MQEALESVEGGIGDLIQITVYLTDMSDRAVLNGIYADFVGSAQPARSCVGVASLPYGARVEIEALAVIDG